MDHEEWVRENATEKYLLEELDPDLRDQFEEHIFDCQECAMDVRAAAMFVEQSRTALAESPVTSAACVPLPERKPARLSWLRPAFTVPVLALLLTVVGYQSYLLQSASKPQVATLVALNVGTRSVSDPTAEPPTVAKIAPGEGFNLLVNRPPDAGYSAYILELYNPAGKLQWAGRLPASSPDDVRSIYVPGAELEQGNYTLAIRKVSATGEEVEKHPIEVQIQR